MMIGPANVKISGCQLDGGTYVVSPLSNVTTLYIFFFTANTSAGVMARMVPMIITCSGVAPAGMIFVPSKEGRSHSAAEWTAWNDIEAGANTLLQTLINLAE